jgi:fibrillarin-like pre-rRNA processing protein
MVETEETPSFGVFRLGRDLYTKNLDPGRDVYGEVRAVHDGAEYRRWNPKRSKLSAALHSGLAMLPFKQDSVVLYLGAAAGTTVSHISDICTKGLVFSVEFSVGPFTKLMELSKKRGNIIPILEDANHPSRYAQYLSKADVIVQDISQRNQAEILIMNAMKFARPDTPMLFAVKSRSIDAAKAPSLVFEKVKSELSGSCRIAQIVDISAYEEDHVLFVVYLK